LVSLRRELARWLGADDPTTARSGASTRFTAVGRSGRVLLLLACLGLASFLAYLQFDQIRNDRAMSQRAGEAAQAEAQLLRFLALHQEIVAVSTSPGPGDTSQVAASLGEAQTASRQSLAELKQVFARNPRILVNLGELEKLAARHLAEAPARPLSGRESRVVIDRLHAIVDQVIASERAQLDQLREQAALTRLHAEVLAAVLQLVLLALLAWAFGAYVRQVGRAVASTRQALDSSARDAALFASAFDAIVVLDEEGCIESVNPAGERLFGRRSDELNGKPIANLFADQARAATIKALLHRVATRSGRRFQTLVKLAGKRADGTRFDAEVAISAVSLGAGWRFLAVIRDMTERWRVDRMKNEFVATVSHELRTPLTSIAGSLGLVAGGAAGPLEPRASKLVTIALNNSQRLVRLINDILDIEKIESGKMVFRLQHLALRPLVADVVQANLGFASGNNITVELEHGGESAAVRADPDRLAQVLTNLLSNAIKFSPPNALVRLRITPGAEQHRVTIVDQGPGIAPEFQHRLFSRFAQGDSSNTRSQGGTGLGLAIVKEILERTGGTISYETGASGTAFHVDLPAHRDARRRGVLLVRRCRLLRRRGRHSSPA
jgi:PAS domain S-box-containing protein